jgi:hypothetical protein
MPWSTMADMAYSDDEKLEQMMPMPMSDRPDYPCGLCICLTQVELDKLGIEADCDVGDVIDLRAFASVKSVTKSGDNCRVELQIEKLAIENEMDEEVGDDDD